MKNSILIFVFLLIGFSSYAQNNGEKNFIDQNYIEVTGTAEMEIIPNEIQITISVKDKDFKTKQAFEEYEKGMILKLKETGISIDKEFSVLNMNSYLKTSLFGKDDVSSSKQYMVVVHDAETANKVFETLEKIDVNTVAITKFDHSEIDKYRLNVKVNAIKAAKDKAQALTSAIGQSIGRALYINEGASNIYQPNVYANTLYSNKLESDYQEIDKVNFQKIKINYSVTVRFELK